MSATCSCVIPSACAPERVSAASAIPLSDSVAAATVAGLSAGGAAAGAAFISARAGAAAAAAVEKPGAEIRGGGGKAVCGAGAGEKLRADAACGAAMAGAPLERIPPAL